MKKLLTILAVCLLFGGVAYATIPDSGGVIHGCYKVNGDLRVIDSPSQSCAMNETALTWSQTGPQGPPGISGYEIVSNTMNLEVGEQNLQVPCPAGKNATGGGFHLSNAGQNEQVIHSYPGSSSWTVGVNASVAGDTLEVFVVCVVVA